MIDILSNYFFFTGGSSFDRLSTASAGSDSGHHSDFGDDRNNKMKVIIIVECNVVILDVMIEN